MIKRIGALLKIIAPLSDPPSEKMHRLKNWSPPGIERGSMALNAIALTARPYIYIYIPSQQTHVGPTWANMGIMWVSRARVGQGLLTGHPMGPLWASHGQTWDYNGKEGQQLTWVLHGLATWVPHGHRRASGGHGLL